MNTKFESVLICCIENEAITMFAGCVKIPIIFLKLYLVKHDYPILHSLVPIGVLGINIKYRRWLNGDIRRPRDRRKEGI